MQVLSEQPAEAEVRPQPWTLLSVLWGASVPCGGYKSWETSWGGVPLKFPGGGGGGHLGHLGCRSGGVSGIGGGVGVGGDDGREVAANAAGAEGDVSGAVSDAELIKGVVR
jgi:hypothetical protein